MPPASDENQELAQLILRLCEENRDASVISELIQYSNQRLESLARHMLRDYPGLRRWVETDDVLQNSFMRLMRALESVEVESPRHFMALSALQIRRELIDLARHYFGPRGLGRKHETRIGTDTNKHEHLEIADLTNEPHSLAQWCELHEQIDSLPEHEREVFDLIYYDGLNQIEAAKVLEISVRTIQRRWHNALLLLHEKVGDHFPDF